MSEPSESPKSRRNPRFSFPEGLKVRWLLGLFAWILWGGSLLPPFSPPAAAIPREIRYGLTDHPPVFVRTPTGEASGFLPDLLREIARRKGWQIRFVFAEGNELVRMLQAGELDLLNMVPTPRLEKLFDFGKEPVFSTWYTFYTLPNRGVLSFQDLKGRKVAIQRGFYALVELKEILRQTRTDAKVVEYPTQGEAFRALLERRVDACAAEQLTSLGDGRGWPFGAAPWSSPPPGSSSAPPRDATRTCCGNWTRRSGCCGRSPVPPTTGCAAAGSTTRT